MMHGWASDDLNLCLAQICPQAAEILSQVQAEDPFVSSLGKAYAQWHQIY